MSDVLSTAAKYLQDAQYRCKQQGHDNRLRRPLPKYVVGQHVLVERESALRNEDNADEEKTRKDIASRREGPFPVVAAVSNIITLIRHGLKDHGSKTAWCDLILGIMQARIP